MFSWFVCLWRHTISRRPRTHAYQWPSGVIGAFEKKKNRVNLVCAIFKLFSWTLRHVFGDENLEYGILTLWIGCLASSNDGCLNLIVVCYVFRLLCFVIFYFRSVISCSVRARQMTQLVGELHPDSYLYLYPSFFVYSTNNAKDCKYVW